MVELESKLFRLAIEVNETFGVKKSAAITSKIRELIRFSNELEPIMDISKSDLTIDEISDQVEVLIDNKHKELGGVPPTQLRTIELSRFGGGGWDHQVSSKVFLRELITL